jgi:hypothetical protein
MKSLTRQRQTSTVAAYKALSNRLRGLSERHKLSYFLSGLKDEIRLHVRMLNPHSLNAAFNLAKIQEEYILSGKKAIKTMQDFGRPSILGTPNVDPKPKIPIQRI